MNDFSNDIAGLIAKYLDNGLDRQEQAYLDAWVAESEDNRKLFEKLTDKERLFLTAAQNDVDKARGWVTLDNQVNEYEELNKVIPFHHRWMKAVASVAAVLVLGVLTYVWINDSQKQKQVSTVAPTVELDKAVGSTGAVLVLGDGKKIVLDSAADGSLATQGDANIIKQGGSVIYSGTGGAADKEIYNTLSTPRGRFFQLKLPDGSSLWLNSASEITFPTAFTGTERRIALKGEAYLEVVKGKKPFIVTVGDMEVQVLGTHFNISSYKDNGVIRTTLLEGQVKVKNANSAVILNPGQQAVFQDRKLTVNKTPNTEAIVSWKNGMLVFDGVDLPSMLAQLSRWYDIDFTVNGKINIPPIYGKVRRDSNLSETIQLIEKNSKLKFKVSNDKVIVSQQ